MNKNIQKTSGFTLIELMVTMSIFTLLITAFYRSSNDAFQQRNAVRDEITTIESLFSTARNMAITSKGVPEAGGTGTVVPQYGYGVHVAVQEFSGVNYTTFTLFADTELIERGVAGDTSDDEFGFSSGDTIISEYSAFTRGRARGVDTEISFIEKGGVLKPEKIAKNLANREFTILFTPLNAVPLLLFNNNYQDINYQGFQINFYHSGLIEEEILFNSVARFFQRERVCPSKNALPADCSTRQSP